MADGLTIEGVDYAGTPHPNIGGLVAAKRVFACRYGGPGGSWKHLTAGEAAALSAAGVAIVANAEGSADGLLGGRSAGESWARSAEAHFAACGMPAGRPIYLSVDFDVSSSQWPAVREALKGAASVLGLNRVGVYGGRRAIEWARRDGVARWYWQTYAWSGGVWVPGNHIEQYRNHVALAGATLDLNRALATDYGQWTVGGVGMADQTGAIHAAIFEGGGSCGDYRAPANGLKSSNSLIQKADYTARGVDAVLAALASIAERVDVDPAELATIRAAAAEGARAGVLASVDELVTAFVSALPDDVASREDVVSALREVLLTGVGATQA